MFTRWHLGASSLRLRIRLGGKRLTAATARCFVSVAPELSGWLGPVVLRCSPLRLAWLVFCTDKAFVLEFVPGAPGGSLGDGRGQGE